MTASERVFERLSERHETVCFAESLTGGLIAATFIENPGASAVINESYVTYSPEAKMRILGVRRETVDTVGVVSERCAVEMAEGARRASRADWAVSATGLAGPEGGTDEIPVGTVYIGIAGANASYAVACHFKNKTRNGVRHAACRAALRALLAALE